MPRQARIVIPKFPHHVTQRGNNRQDIFFVDEDRRFYLETLGQQAGRFGLTIQGYCLMTNHIHLIVTPAEESSLAKAIGRTHWLYSQHVNRLHGRSGHLWQNRFFSCGLDDEQFWTAMAYVERNPVRAGLTSRAWQWPWSSAAAHVAGKDSLALLNLADWAKRLPPDANWRDTLARAEDKACTTRIRLGTTRGRPLGTDSFLGKLETRLGLRLRALPRGRPPTNPNLKSSE